MKMEWKKYITRENTDLVTLAVLATHFFELVEKFSKYREEVFFSIFSAEKFTHYSKIDFYEIGKKIIKEYFNSEQKLNRYYTDRNEWWKKDQQISKKWKKNLTSKINKEKLIAALNDFKESFFEVDYSFSIMPFVAIEAWQKDFNNILKKLIQANGLEDIEDSIIFSATKPWKKTALIEIEEKLKKDYSIKKITSNYQFLRSWTVVWHRPIDEKWVKNIKDSYKNEKKLKRFSRIQLIKMLKPNQVEKKFMELAPYLIFIKDWRDDMRRKHAFSWNFLFTLISRFFGVDYKDIGYLTLDEIKDSLIRGKIDKGLISRRKEDIWIVARDRKKTGIKVIDGAAQKKYKKIIKNCEKIKKGGIIKGVIAQRGVSRGIVKILNTYHDVKHFQDGYVLVANTTHPNYLPAMKRAAAFVTNEGGIISHAAIVARELKKPCIVATKVATQILKDGDFVEVDADKGIVKIIK